MEAVSLSTGALDVCRSWLTDICAKAVCRERRPETERLWKVLHTEKSWPRLNVIGPFLALNDQGRLHKGKYRYTELLWTLQLSIHRVRTDRRNSNIRAYCATAAR